MASNFVILPQSLIFSVFKVASLSPYWLQIKFSMSLFFYLFTFAISLWHRQQTSLQRLSTINMVFSDEDKILIKTLYLKGYTAKRLTDEFPEKSWTECGVNMLLKKFDIRATKRYHTATGSFQLHPHFIKENNYAVICVNISNILLAHKYTQHTHACRGIKIGALKMQFVCISSISAEYLQKIWISNFPR